MRKCCCCVSVHIGSIILGLIAVVIAALELVCLVPYLFDMDGFNPIRTHLNEVYYVVENIMEEQNMTKEAQEEVMNSVRQHLWTALLCESVFACIYICVSLLMIFGAKCRKRALMVPYLVIQLLILVVFVLVGIGATIALFFISYIMGAICTGVVLLVSFLFIYFWFTVQRTYKEIGNRDYMYSPAPMKPIYNPPMDNRYNHPTSPQQFNME